MSVSRLVTVRGGARFLVWNLVRLQCEVEEWSPHFFGSSTRSVGKYTWELNVECKLHAYAPLGCVPFFLSSFFLFSFFFLFLRQHTPLCSSPFVSHTSGK